uniref:CUB_2 domain-containing protein n=1 Tax=Caenorhabditis tropicalis TaxID=1561998 RepID=A0A1I7TY03_9PELO
MNVTYKTYGYSTYGFEVDVLCTKSDFVPTSTSTTTATTQEITPRITSTTSTKTSTTSKLTTMTTRSTTTVTESTSMERTASPSTMTKYESTTILANNDQEPFIFTYPQFQVELLAANQTGRFAFKVFWSYYPSEICKNNIQLDTVQLIPSTSTECMTTYTAPNKVRLIAFGPASSESKILRHSAVFEGDSLNGTYLGNLYEANNRNIWSKGTQLTVYTYGLKVQNSRSLFLGMDSTVGKNVAKFSGLDCSEYPDKSCYIWPYHYLPFNDNTAVITASRDVDYLYYLYYPDKFGDNTTLSIYEGQLNDEHLLIALNKSNYNYQLPIAVKNTVKIYTVDEMSVSLQRSNSPTPADWGTVYYGSRVIFHSFDYKTASTQQDTAESITTSYSNLLVDFNINVKYFDFPGPTTLDIQVNLDGNIQFFARYTGTNPPPSNMFTAFGNSMNVTYKTYGYSTYGFEVDVLCTKSDFVPTSTSTTTPSTTTAPATTRSTTTVTESTSTESTASPSTMTKYESTTSTSSKHNLSILLLAVVFFV